MNHYAIIVLILAVAALHSCEAAAFGDECGPNKSWTNCGTACPPTCGQPVREFCTLQCVIGCQCSRGFSLASDGSCVSQCP